MSPNPMIPKFSASDALEGFRWQRAGEPKPEGAQYSWEHNWGWCLAWLDAARSEAAAIRIIQLQVV